MGRSSASGDGSREFSGGPMVGTALSLPRPRVQSPVRELGSPAGSRAQSKRQKQKSTGSIRLSTA